MRTVAGDSQASGQACRTRSIIKKKVELREISGSSFWWVQGDESNMGNGGTTSANWNKRASIEDAVRN